MVSEDSGLEAEQVYQVTTTTQVEGKQVRLFFIDALRAWAILMMLQGHFVDGLLDTAFRDPENIAFRIWKYFRGITAPVFFTVSGFIFTFLLARQTSISVENPRIIKGIKRGLQLILIGYLLRMNFFGLLNGEIYNSFYLVDVLQCIGLSILGIIGVHQMTRKSRNWVFPSVLLLITGILFLLEPLYKTWNFDFLPMAIANYFTKTNGSIFTIIPWMGYAMFGGFLALVFHRFQSAKLLYPVAISFASLAGLALIFLSSDFFMTLFKWSGISLFSNIYFNNYLFIRLGDVLVVFAIFMLFRSYLNKPLLLRLGQNTLSIYVIHFIILYGSFTGIGLYYYLSFSLSPGFVISGALLFMVLCSYLALRYEEKEAAIKTAIAGFPKVILEKTDPILHLAQRYLKAVFAWMVRVLGLVKS